MREIYNLMNEFNNMFFNDGGYKSFPIDVVEVEGGYEVYAEIPGVNKEDINITFEEGNLTIEALLKNNKDKKYLINERKATKLRRVVSFGNIEEDKLSAKYENGVLAVSILTKAPEVKKPKSINIE